MFKVPIDKIIPVTNARAQIASLVKTVQRTSSLYVLTRGGKPAAILASIDYINRHLGVKNDGQATGLEKYKKEENLPEFKKPMPVVPSAVKPAKDALPKTTENDSEPLVSMNDDQNNNISHSFDAEEPVKISIK